MDCFDVEVNAEEAETTFELNNTHVEKDHEKLFEIYESYLNANSDNEECYDSQNEISFDEHFTHIIKARIANHSKKRTKRYSCLADIEKSAKEFDSRKSLNKSKNVDNIALNNDRNDAKLEFNLNDMTDEQIVEFANKLENELYVKMNSYSQIVANNLKNVYRKNIDAIKQKQTVCDVDCTQQKSGQQFVPFDRLLSKELNNIEANSNLIEKLIEDLKLCEKLCHNNDQTKNKDQKLVVSD